MRWQRPARWIVAALGIGTAVVLYQQTRERPAIERPPVATPADPEATVQSGQGTDVRYRSGEVEFQISYEGLRQYPDDRVVWDKARFRVDDGTFLCADEIESRGPESDGMPTELKLRGNVCMDTAEGASIRAEQATYSNSTGVAILPGPVTFTHGSLSGSGTDGEYHRDAGIFHLRTDARVTTADEEEGSVVATSASMTFDRTRMVLLLNEQARIEHVRQVLTSEHATLHLGESRDRFDAIELRGNAHVAPMPGHETEMPDMRARNIDLTFYAGTQALERAVLVGDASMVLVEGTARRSIEADDITMTTASDGRTVTHIDASDRKVVTVRTPAQTGQAARTITAPRLIASGTEEKGLTAAVFSGGARLEEVEPAAAGRPASTRVGTAETLTLVLAGQLDAVQEAQFQRNFKFESGDVRGDADLGTYVSSAGRLTLRPARTPARLPRLGSGRVTVDARELIDVDLDTKDLHARGDVKTVSAPAESASNEPARTGLFNDRDVMYGFATEFWYEESSSRARYRGTEKARARVRQGETTVEGEAIEMSDETRDLTAKGSVESTFSAVGGGASKDPRRYKVTAATLEYRDEPRTATYNGEPVTLTGPEDVTVARTMVMTLSVEGSELERLDARTNVHVTFKNGREALADTLLYEDGLSRYTLRGQPLLLRVPDDEASTCSLWRARVCYFTTDGGSPECPSAENRSPVERTGVACTGPLPK